MSMERARAALERCGLADRIIEFEVSSATVALAAQALGCEPARIDNGKFKARFAMKAHMLAHDDVERLVGHAVGGVCPFGVKDGVPVYLDESLRRFDVVYPAAGTDASAVRLSIDELERASGAEGWVDVCK